jgi:hypothetical protein
MHKLRQDGNSYYVEHKKEFRLNSPLKEETIKQVFDFAYSMTFGKDGEHRDHRTGGELNRKKGQIFINTFQGKLAELAVYNAFHTLNPNAYKRLSSPDFEVYGLGEWDDSDIVLDQLKFSIKSTKHYGNLLLLEQRDWNSNGEYLPNTSANKGSLYDFFVLVRIKPDGEKLMRGNRLLYNNDYIEKSHLLNIIDKESWEYDVPGYITMDDFKQIISNKLVLPQKALLNGKIPMDATNYYIQSGDMRDLEALIPNL